MHMVEKPNKGHEKASFSFPTFRSGFLNHLCAAFQKRSRSLSKRGSLKFASDPQDAVEWISIYYRMLVGQYVILQGIEDNRINLFLRSSRKHNRGKILLSLENLALVDNAQLLVETFERTLRLSHGLREGVANNDLTEKIKEEWAKVALRVTEPPALEGKQKRDIVDCPAYVANGWSIGSPAGCQVNP